jgi:hypothetical protein
VADSELQWADGVPDQAVMRLRGWQAFATIRAAQKR